MAELMPAALWWLIGGIALLILEMLTGTLFFMLMSLGALTVALLVWGLNIPVPVQGIIFALSAIAGVLAWRRWRSNIQDEVEGSSDLPGLNNRMARFVGREGVLEKAIVNGQGRIRLEDSWWDAVGVDMPAGTRVRVVGVDGIMLRVEAI